MVLEVFFFLATAQEATFQGSGNISGHALANVSGRAVSVQGDSSGLGSTTSAPSFSYLLNEDLGASDL